MVLHFNKNPPKYGQELFLQVTSFMEDEQGLVKQDRDHGDRKQGHNQLSMESSRLACGSVLNKRGLDRAVQLQGRRSKGFWAELANGVGPVARNLQVPGWPHV